MVIMVIHIYCDISLLQVIYIEIWMYVIAPPPPKKNHSSVIRMLVNSPLFHCLLIVWRMRLITINLDLKIKF